ncbi:hypothetical protein V6N13_091158 [Hibiscus sabdariffa]
MGSRKKYKVLESGDLVTGRNLRPYRRAIGVVVKEKVESKCLDIGGGSPNASMVVRDVCKYSMFWGRLVRVEDNTVEPQSFERVHFLMETSWMKRIEETVEIIEWEDSVVRIQVQEIEIMHSHDIVCSCDRESDDGKRETRVNGL